MIGLYTGWLHSPRLLAGWATGIVIGTLMAYSQGYAGVFALVANLAVATVGTILCALPAGARPPTTPGRTSTTASARWRNSSRRSPRPRWHRAGTATRREAAFRR